MDAGHGITPPPLENSGPQQSSHLSATPGSSINLRSKQNAKLRYRCSVSLQHFSPILVLFTSILCLNLVAYCITLTLNTVLNSWSLSCAHNFHSGVFPMGMQPCQPSGLGAKHLQPGSCQRIWATISWRVSLATQQENPSDASHVRFMNTHTRDGEKRLFVWEMEIILTFILAKLGGI